MKKILLVGCGSEIGSNLLLLSKRYNFKFDITTVINSPIKLDNKFEKLDQADAIISRLRLAYPLNKKDIKKLRKDKILIFGKSAKLIFSNVNDYLKINKTKKWDAIILATSKEDLQDSKLLNKLKNISKLVFGMAESRIMESYYPATYNFNSNLLNINNIKDKKLISFGSCQTNGWLAQMQVFLRAFSKIKEFKIHRVEVDIVHPDTPTGRLGTKSFSPREQDARNNLRPSFSQIDSAMSKILNKINSFHTVSLRTLNEEPGYQINRFFFSGDLSHSLIKNFEKNIKRSCDMSNGISSFDYLPLGSKAYKYRKEIAHILPMPYLKISKNCFLGNPNIHEVITQAYVSNVFGYCYNSLKAIKQLI